MYLEKFYEPFESKEPVKYRAYDPDYNYFASVLGLCPISLLIFPSRTKDRFKLKTKYHLLPQPHELYDNHSIQSHIDTLARENS